MKTTLRITFTVDRPQPDPDGITTPFQFVSDHEFEGEDSLEQAMQKRRDELRRLNQDPVMDDDGHTGEFAAVPLTDDEYEAAEKQYDSRGRLVLVDPATGQPMQRVVTAGKYSYELIQDTNA